MAAEESCRAVVNAFGLRYSSIDMVEDTSGKIFFLELNPNGQWAWIEQLTGHPIRDAIIDALTPKE
jgi:glutathione synthase/RimK-type ligase-like ATP-grasp enzyme